MASWFDQISRREARAHASSISMLQDATPAAVNHSFVAYANDGYKGNGPVFSLIATRAMSLKGVRFAFQTKERPHKLTTGPELLETPWPGGTTAQLISRLETDASLAGNSYWRKVSDRLVWMRPDWVGVISAIPKTGLFAEVQAEILMGYVYWPGGKGSGSKGVTMLPGDVAHYKPVPDPLHQHLGQSWITPVAQEADSDTLMTRHKRRFFFNAATPSIAVVSQSTLSPDQRKLLKEQFAAKHESWENAYKTVYLEGGADIKVVGATLEQMSFKTVQGAGETRLASAAGVPPIVVGFAEGLQASTYSNYGQAVRRYADGTLRPTWGDMAATFAPLVDVPTGSRLWYDDRDVALLQQDAADGAAIVKEQALTIEALIRAGFDPDTAKEAVITGSFEDLEHSGLVSVQLLPPGDDGEPARVTSIPDSTIHKTLQALMEPNDD